MRVCGSDMAIWKKSCLNGFAMVERTVLQWIAEQWKWRLIKWPWRWVLILNTPVDCHSGSKGDEILSVSREGASSDIDLAVNC